MPSRFPRESCRRSRESAGASLALPARAPHIYDMPDSRLPDWNTLASLGDDELRLLDTALLIARDEYPELDPRESTEAVDGYVRALRPRLDSDLDLPSRLTAINNFLFDELGFAGNH